MLLPALGKAKNLGTKSNCSGQMRQIGLTVQEYLADNNDFFPCDRGYYPSAYYGASTAQVSGYAKKYSRVNMVYNSGEIVQPDANGYPYANLAMTYLKGDFTLFYCPGDKRTNTLSPLYCTSDNSYAYLKPLSPNTAMKRSIRPAQKMAAARQLLMVEAQNGNRINTDDAWFSTAADTASSKRNHPHDRDYNFLYIDGHTQSFSMDSAVKEFSQGWQTW